MPSRFTLRRSQRLAAPREFHEVRQRGRRVVRGCLIANWLALPAGLPSRLGLVTSRKLGSAVLRNRARRLLREVFRRHQHEFSRPVAIVLVARASIVGRPLPEVERDFLAALGPGVLSARGS